MSCFTGCLKRIFLIFEDRDMSRRYAEEKKDLYKKAIPIVAMMMLILTVAIEVLYRVLDTEAGELDIQTTIINAACLVAFIVLSVFVRYLWWTCWFVCPLLTGLVYYYFGYLDFERTQGIVYFKYHIPCITPFIVSSLRSPQRIL